MILIDKWFTLTYDSHSAYDQHSKILFTLTEKFTLTNDSHSAYDQHS